MATNQELEIRDRLYVEKEIDREEKQEMSDQASDFLQEPGEDAHTHEAELHELKIWATLRRRTLEKYLTVFTHTHWTCNDDKSTKRLLY